MEEYLAYLRGCAEYNQHQSPEPGWEWHHTLPQCLFGDQPIGLYLSIEQHAIASVLQSEAFGHCCCCGAHKQHLPEALLPLFRKWMAQNMKVARDKTDPQAKSEQSRKNANHPNFRAAADEALSKIDRSAAGKQGSASTNTQLWQCLVTGKVSTPGPLTKWQRRHQVDPSMRKRIQ